MKFALCQVLVFVYATLLLLLSEGEGTSSNDHCATVTCEADFVPMLSIEPVRRRRNEYEKISYTETHGKMTSYNFEFDQRYDNSRLWVMLYRKTRYETDHGQTDNQEENARFSNVCSDYALPAERFIADVSILAHKVDESGLHSDNAINSANESSSQNDFKPIDYSANPTLLATVGKSRRYSQTFNDDFNIEIDAASQVDFWRARLKIYITPKLTDGTNKARSKFCRWPAAYSCRVILGFSESAGLNYTVFDTKVVELDKGKSDAEGKHCRHTPFASVFNDLYWNWKPSKAG